MIHRIKEAIAFVLKRWSVPVKEEVKRGLKLDKGVVPENNTFLVMEDKGKMTFTKVKPGLLETISNRFIGGFLGKLNLGQVIVGLEYVARAVPKSDLDKKINNLADAVEFVMGQKKHMSGAFKAIEHKLNVWILPVVCGGEFKMFGRKMKFRKFLTIPKMKRGKSELSLIACLNKRYKEAFGTRAITVENDLAKSLDYLATNIYRKTFKMTVKCVPTSWCVKPKSLDGAGLVFIKNNPKKLKGEDDPNFLFHHDGRGCDVTRLQVLHVRGLGHGYIFKGTIVPVSYHIAKVHFKAEHKKEVLEALKAGHIVCTTDTLKKGRPGMYENMEFGWHDDSNQNSFWNEVKLCFSQYAFKRRWIHFEGLKDILRKRVEEFCEAVKHIDTLVGYIVKHRQAFNDENVSMLGIVETLMQVRNRRPFGLHRSDTYSIKKPMANILKNLLSPMIGTRTMRDWNLKKHHGIAARAFILGDPTLKKGEFGVPKFCDRMICKKMGNMAIHEEARRHPQTITSSLPVKRVVRDDDLPYFTVPVEDMSNYGADFDGDHMEFLVYPAELYEIEDLRQDRIDGWTRVKIDKGTITRLCPTRESKAPIGVIDHHNRLAELLFAVIGPIHYIIECMMHWSYKVRNYSWKTAFKISNILETGPLDKIIDGKKHNYGSVPSLPMLGLLANTLRIYGTARHDEGKGSNHNGYRMLNGKLDFTTITQRHPKTKEKLELDVKYVPLVIKKCIANTWICDEHYPIHSYIMRLLNKLLPDTIEGAELDQKKCNYPVVSEMASALWSNWGTFLGNKIGFDRPRNCKFRHKLLAAIQNEFMRISREEGDSEKAQRYIKAKMEEVWTKLMELAPDDKHKVVAELAMMCFAWINVTSSERTTKKGTVLPPTRASKHPRIFALVSSATFKKFMDILYGEGEHTDPQNIIDSLSDPEMQEYFGTIGDDELDDIFNA